MLTWPPSCSPGDASELCQPKPKHLSNSTTAWTPPFFNADLIYGWPIDPRHFNASQATAEDGSRGTFVITQIILVVLSMTCPVVSVLLMANKHTLDPPRVLFCQGFGALLYCLVGKTSSFLLITPACIKMKFFSRYSTMGEALVRRRKLIHLQCCHSDVWSGPDVLVGSFNNCKRCHIAKHSTQSQLRRHEL